MPRSVSYYKGKSFRGKAIFKEDLSLIGGSFTGKSQLREDFRKGDPNSDHLRVVLDQRFVSKKKISELREGFSKGDPNLDAYEE